MAEITVSRRGVIRELAAMVRAALGMPRFAAMPDWRCGAFTRGSPSPSSILDRTGINLRAAELDERTVNLVLSYGFRWIRTDISWRTVESRPGLFDFADLQQRLQTAVNKGLKVLGILDYGHPLYTGMLAPRDEHQRSAFVRFAVEAVRELGSVVSAWEVWNEPNHPRFWPPRPDVSDYNSLLSAVATGVWSQNANAVLIAGGLSTVDQRFLAGLLPLVDSLAREGPMGLGLHPYRFTPPETVAGELQRVGLLRGDGKAATDRGVPVWLTEWGYCRGTGGITATRQAEWMVRVPLVGAALDSPVTVLFELRDGGPQQQCGMVNPRDEPYPVSRAWQGMMRVLQKTASTFRVVPVGSDAPWSIGSCESALVWGRAPEGEGPFAPIACEDGDPACSTGVWEVAPARDHWLSKGKSCQ